MGGAVECKQCSGEMKKSTKNNRSSAKQIIGILLIIVGGTMLITPYLIVGIVLMLCGGMLFGGKTTKIWKCKNCGYFFERA